MTVEQISKRHRDLRKQLNGLRPPSPNELVVGRGSWLYRKVGETSLGAMQAVAHRIKDTEATPKTSSFTLSLIYPDELQRALQRSRLRGIVSLGTIEARLLAMLPDSVQRPVVAETLGLKQYRSMIGVQVTYPEFADERERVAVGLNNILGIRNAWVVEPHISVARGQLSDLSNLNKLQDALAPEVELTHVLRKPCASQPY